MNRKSTKINKQNISINKKKEYQQFKQVYCYYIISFHQLEPDVILII